MAIPDTELTPKQEHFCREYCLTGNKTEAYRRAYSCGNMKPATINRRAWELYATGAGGKIKARIQALDNNAAELVGVTKSLMIQDLKDIAFTSFPGTGNYDDAGTLTSVCMTPEEFKDLTAGQRRCLKKVKVNRHKVGPVIAMEEIEIEVKDDLRAKEMLNKMLGWNAPDKLDLGGGVTPLRIEDVTDTASAQKLYQQMIEESE